MSIAVCVWINRFRFSLPKTFSIWRYCIDSLRKFTGKLHRLEEGMTTRRMTICSSKMSLSQFEFDLTANEENQSFDTHSDQHSYFSCCMHILRNIRRFPKIRRTNEFYDRSLSFILTNSTETFNCISGMLSTNW